jgi:TPR repeat protein
MLNCPGVIMNSSAIVRIFFFAFLLATVFLVAPVCAENTPGIDVLRVKAESGDAEAQSRLGECYLKGEGVPKDDAQAVTWYRKAAEQGLAEAQFYLGVFYAAGKKVLKDSAQAFKWYRKAAEQGHVMAQEELGFSYAGGEGVPKDDIQAVVWFRKAAEQGSLMAQTKLGLCYEMGEGVPKDLVQAYMWFNLAAAQSLELAAERRGIIEKQMTPDQIAQAQRLSAAFVPKSPVKGNNVSSADNSTASTPDKLAGSGTGFFLTSDGWMVTNAHVATAGKKAMVKLGDTLFPAVVKRVDAANDLALIKVEGQFNALALERAGGVTLGASVFTVGFPNPGLQGFSPKMTKGEISSVAGFKDDPRYFQISLPIQPGNSGGALADVSGNVVGVVSAMISDKIAIESTGAIPQNVNYAVKSTYLLALIESIPDGPKA